MINLVQRCQRGANTLFRRQYSWV